MHTMTLSAGDIAAINPLIDRVLTDHDSVEAPELARVAPLLAHELPRSVREFLAEFRLDEPSGACVLSGFPVDDDRIGDTPAHWRRSATAVPSPTLRQEVFFLLCASLLGDLFAWSTQQDGLLMHDVMPIKGHEQEQLGSGSEQVLWWHTEDAFHPFKGDYVALMCLRNPDAVATTLADAARIRWADLDLDTLFAPHYTIRPDESHLPKNRGDDQDEDPARAALVDAGYRRITALNENPPRVPLLTGDRNAPYMCLDPYFMAADDLEPTARKAFEAMVGAIDAALEDVVLRPGDCLFVDNLRAVHGRNPFRARFDGKDRWLKRLNVSRDLRRSREARLASSHRVIF
ncbi:guanitoxin biosynthesis L-enduracididine beta-hydroxylase GntD [Kitasatospora sp. NPDC058162]|uniref:guanitoxin biosynthesis L-enduracididine beta-hydroxylase GntD n=1 Tax=Kitasatospora sp. NPDC058162 TaxID=3346362 RepID=UPI0036D859D0